MQLDSNFTKIEALGEPKIVSPLRKIRRDRQRSCFVSNNGRVIMNAVITLDDKDKSSERPSFEIAGPREYIYFDPSKLRCGIVTCGGLCPGLNIVIRSIVLELYNSYGVRSVYGFKYGLEGFIPEYGHEVVDLTPDHVSSILDMGGSILGSSRGPQEVERVVDCIERMNIGILFIIGGDGTLKAASRIQETVKSRNLKISVIGIPKTIDNDIFLTDRTFGFETAVEVATVAVKGAHNEAKGYPNGIGLVKLMGRNSGSIAVATAIAQHDVDFVLIPEVDFDLDGENGFLRSLEKRLVKKKYAVVIVAEGAGQKFFESEKTGNDDSGNVRFNDIGVFLKEKISSYFKEIDTKISLKYIDPSYSIRNLPANVSDSIFCNLLGRDAVHAGMTGKTGMLIGSWNNYFVHLPISASVGKTKQVDTEGKLWLNVYDATGQGSLKNTKPMKGE